MVETKKVIFIGPPGTGKTTIKKIFFEMVSPLKLLKNTLDPTRGINSSIHSFFNLDLGVFDLAGQENENWFSKEVFQDFKLDLQIIVQYSDLKEHKITDLFYDLDLSSKNATLRLKRLEKLGFLEFSENSRNFQLTERANFFKLGLKSEEIDEKETKINKILESLYIFSNLNQKNEM